MCNIYRLKGGTAEIASLFQATPSPGANYGEEVFPGYPGLVIADGWAQTMTWGFPLALTGKQGQKLKPKPVTSAREDKLHTGFRRPSFDTRRCLIPASAWAEAVSEKRRMTRTWYALPGGEPFAISWLWRTTVEWSHAYFHGDGEQQRRGWSMFMTGCPSSCGPKIGQIWLTGRLPMPLTFARPAPAISMSITLPSVGQDSTSLATR